ncbi:hypothetical protein [Pseudomonas sp. HS6]|uniref:hypothetical protein n=1 Tax=Pseudomonas sp. HS6 TaxID=2850559 RepID=UPI0020198405|nr:hypothetical protein [Pseudomonas sp. HS6]
MWSWVNWTLGANLENLFLAGTANLNGTGNELANYMIGNAVSRHQLHRQLCRRCHGHLV